MVGGLGVVIKIFPTRVSSNNTHSDKNALITDIGKAFV